jgi:hypothetical protein
MDGFDLNIQNYTIKELKGLLSLGDVYDTYDVGVKKENICKKVSNDDTITIDMKIKMNNFIESVSKILLNLLESSSSSSSSSSSNYSLVKRGDDTIDDNTSFTDLKNIMQKGSNDMIIQDPFAVHIRKINNNDNPGLNFDQYGTKRGVINPLLKNTIIRGLNIDSRYRDDYYTTQSTDLSITLPYRLENVISYRLVSVSIPITYYNVSQHYGNNVIRIETYTSLAGAYSLLNTFDLILQDGIYNTTQNLNTFSASIETEINNILNSNPNSPNVAIPLLPGPPVYTSPKLVYTINRVNGKSIFAQDVTATQPYYFKIITNVELNISTGQVNIDFDINKGIITRLGWTLGFRTAEHYSSNFNPVVLPPPSIYGSVISLSICFTKYPIYGFLSIDDFNNNVNDYYTSVFSNSISVPNIISKIDLTRLMEVSGAFQASQGESSSTSINTERRFFGPVNIQKLKITLYDDLGFILDLNGMDWAIELAFECVYSM